MISNRTACMLGCLITLSAALTACGVSESSSGDSPGLSDVASDILIDAGATTDAMDTGPGPDASELWEVSNPDASSALLDAESAQDAPTEVAQEDASPEVAPEEPGDADAFEETTALEIRLAWSSPESQDPGAETGATFVDLDLHVRHPFALDWFDMPFDCFWFNPAPNWGSLDPGVEDDPVLELDSVDGEGSERVLLSQPEDGSIYRIGVHAWNDNGQGPTQATVSILLGGQLFYEASLPLKNQELWEVATVSWPSGEITSILNAQGDPLVWPEVTGAF